MVLIKCYKKEDEKAEERMTRNFNITSVCRIDLTRNISEEKATKLNNEEMQEIANLMGDYLQESYWECLEMALDKLNIK